MPEEGRSEAPEVIIYIDTCILQGAISRRSDKDTIFMNKAKERGWKVYTSIHTLMELLDVAKDRSFLLKSVFNKWVDVSTFLRERRAKQLSSSDLEEIAEEINTFFKNHSFIEFVDITEDIWKDVKAISEKSTLHSTDILHLALARMYGCHVLATHDSFFRKEGNRILKEANEFGSIRLCDVDKVEETMTELRSEQN